MLPDAPAAIQAFVREALSDRLRAGDIPDLHAGGAANTSRIAIRADMPGIRMKLTATALPELPGVSTELVSLAEARATADRTGAFVRFLAVDRAAIEGDTARIWMGGDFVMPVKAGRVKMCCCVSEAHFRRAGGRWTFVKWVFVSCA
jgi:hypothetical protein